MSCLYQSLHYFVPQDDVQLIRQKICNFLASLETVNAKHAASYLLWESNMDLASFVSEHRLPNTWGEAIHIRVFCELYRMRVMVRVQANGGTPIEFIPADGVYFRTIWIEWQTAHFEPCRT